MLQPPLSRVKQAVTAVGAVPAAGQGDLSLGAAYDATCRTFNVAATTGFLYPYVIKEGSKVEYGYGTPVTGAPWTFQRTVCIWSTAGVGTKETFSSACVVFCSDLGEAMMTRQTQNRARPIDPYRFYLQR